MAFQFPRHPGSERPNPFIAANGTNPFSDNESPPPASEAQDNPYGSATRGDNSGLGHEPAYRPQGYEQRLEQRGVLVFGLGVGACLMAIFGPVLVALDFSLLGVPLAILALTMGLVAWVMGGRDLAAMRLGVMEPAGLRPTRIGYVTAILSVMAMVGLGVLLVARAFLTILAGVA